MEEKHALVIDDMPAMRDAMGSILKDIGFKKITKAIDGNDAYNKMGLASAEGKPVNLIFCDIVMPNCGGIDFLKLINGEADYKDIPVIMVSTENEYSIVIDAISAGARDYIIKPYTKEVVLKKLKSVLSS